MHEPAEPRTGEAKVVVREMTIDDLSEVFHIGEEVFTAEFSPSLYRTWDEYEITTLFNTDSELCLVAERGGANRRLRPGHHGGEAPQRLEVRLPGLARGAPRGAAGGSASGCSGRSSGACGSRGCG